MNSSTSINKNINNSINMPISSLIANSLPKEQLEQSRPKYGLDYLSLLGFLFLLSSALPSAVPQLNAIRLVLIIAFLAIITGIIGKLKRQEIFILHTPSYLVLAFMVTVVIGVPGAIWPGLAFDTAIDAFKILMIFLLITNIIISLRMLLGISWAICLGGLLPALGTIKNYISGENLVEGYRGAWIGLYANPNDLAYIMAMLVTLAIGIAGSTKSKLAKLIAIGCMSLYIITILFTQSRMGFLCLLTIIFITLIRSQQRMRNALLVFVMVIVCLPLVSSTYWQRVQTITTYEQDRSSVGRLEAWEAGIKMFEEHPLLGVGAGCYILGWEQDSQESYTPVRTAHNTFFQALGELGFFGFIFFCLFLITSLKSIWKLRRSLLKKQLILAPNIFKQHYKHLLPLVIAFEAGIWVFIISSLTGGLLFTWYPYIFTAMAISAQEIYQKQLAIECNIK